MYELFTFWLNVLFALIKDISKGKCEEQSKKW